MTCAKRVSGIIFITCAQCNDWKDFESEKTKGPKQGSQNQQENQRA